jgi:hypothetical protein
MGGANGSNGPKRPPRPTERQYRGSLVQEIHLIDLCSLGYLEEMNRITDEGLIVSM